jgi:predicted aspartyl protease
MYQAWPTAPNRRAGVRRVLELLHGTDVVDVLVASVAEPEGSESVTCLVDAGAPISIVPSDLLHKLGVRPLQTQDFILANGQKITREKGTALFKYGERIGGTDLVSGQPGDANILGVITLESLLLGLNPVTRELYDIPAILGSATS